MKKCLLILIFLGMFSVYFAEKIDLNIAELNELKTLPITGKQASDIYEYRYFIKFFKSIYDLREIPSIDQKTLNKLKPLVSVSHYDDKDEAAQRREQIYYLIDRLGSNEGLQEGISDVWEDYLITPKNINHLFFSEILSLPNTSPIDVVAVLKRRANGDTLANYRDLRYSPGISYYGASNIRHYVYYQEKEIKNKIYVDYQFKYDDGTFDEDVQEMYKESIINKLVGGNSEAPREKTQSLWGYFRMDQYSPSIMNKVRIRYNNQWKAGLLFNSQKGEKYLFENNFRNLLKDGKYFAGYEDKLFNNDFLKVYLGNYRVTFGEGLVMENSDFYSARKTGFGFSKRVTGIIGDLSRTQEYALRGSALEYTTSKFNAALFFSKDKKDAVVFDSNQDGFLDDNDDLFSYITMTRRFTNNELKEVEDFYNNHPDNDFVINIAPRKDAFEEQVIGGHFEFSPIIGTHFGVTGYETTYDRDFVVNNSSDSLKYLLIRTPENAEEKWRIINSEIAALYSTKTGNYNRDYRRVLGFDWRTVMNNTSVQGEYAELSVNGKELKIGDDPKAFILSAYSQFENFYILSLYRDYDLDFDNPYARGFSEHEKFDGTVLDSYVYTLSNPLIADLYINSAQAQAEQGVYFETRYRFSKYFTLNRTYLDIWERKADSRKSVRFQGELDFRPIFKLSLRLKYKHQQNRYDDDSDRAVSKTNETTGRIIASLSNMDRLSLEYRYLSVWGPPYPYLTNDPGSGNTIIQGSSLSHADYVCVDYTHNFNQNLKVQGSFIFWDGNGISHWDWEDIEIDFMGEGGMKFWFTIRDKIANNLFLTLKYKIKDYRTKENEWRAWWNEPPEEGEYYFQTVKKTEQSMKLQLDWKF